MHSVVELTERFQRADVLAPAVLVGNPAPVRPAVIEIKHGGDGIHSEPVNVALVYPEVDEGNMGPLTETFKVIRAAIFKNIATFLV